MEEQVGEIWHKLVTRMAGRQRRSKNWEGGRQNGFIRMRNR